MSVLNIHDPSIVIPKVETIDDVKYIYIQRNPVPTFCPVCHSRMHSKGLYTRKINHPILQDSTKVFLILKQRKWFCPVCRHYENERFSFVERCKQSSNFTPLMVINCMKDLQKTTSAVAQQFNLSDTQVHNIFTSSVDLKRLELSEYISIDEVYLNISDTNKYAFVIMDFVTGEIIDIVHNRWSSTLCEYFASTPREERLKVKGIISDAYSPYIDLSNDFFPNAVSILDSFHVVKLLISRLNVYLYKLQKAFHEKDKERWRQKARALNRDFIKGYDSIEVTLLKSYKWVLLKNKDEINYSTQRHYHTLLRMTVDTYQIEERFFKIHPKLKKYRELKEEYISFNQGTYENEEQVKESLERLIHLYQDSNEKIFVDFSLFLNSHKNEIIRSFTTVQVSRKSNTDQSNYYARLSNGPMDSFNRKPKDYKRNTRGSSNFDYTRNRILWSTRENPPILGIPKTHDQIHSYRLSEKTLKKRKKHYNK